MGSMASQITSLTICLLSRVFGRSSKKTSKLRGTGLCAGNSPGTGEFPAEMASYAENVSIWWRHHDKVIHLWQTQDKDITILWVIFHVKEIEFVYHLRQVAKHYNHNDVIT